MLLRERHYTIRELEQLTNISYHTLRRRLRGEPGVVHLGVGHNDPIRVPESVFRRAYDRWTNGATDERPAPPPQNTASG
jgi:hypothetical protein